MPTPWICDRCGDVAQGAMCVKCGNQKGHAQVSSDPNLHVYNPGSVPVTDDGRSRLSEWGTISWVAVGFAVLFLGTVLYAMTLR